MAAVHDEVLLILLLAGLLAKNARLRGFRRLDIAVAPRTPKVVHRNCADGPLGTRRRFRRRSLGRRGMRGVHQVLEFLAGFEIRYALGGHLHARARFRIASHARLTLAGPEASEAANFNLVVRAK